MKNSTHKGMEFLGMGNRAWGMAKKLPMPNAQCPMPNAQCPMPHAAGRLSLFTHKGMEFPAAFNESFATSSFILFIYHYVFARAFAVN
ncbi:hypothetical protein IQ278_12655 [Tolypothrix sp. LEGE 11397]|uniref:hypothetical protein n=1 Tax=unclassified Tolypothrix TaxID=2649714 RepID=UPI0005EAAE13|nr:MULTISPECIES: hypothetical protein [unclassified Tolypothrix]EKF00219.1 hypothetical protein FDUTEX481_09149 [Tolypothrix sp. PCC 7601]MBE9082964.1 hypothetical protein [Tolypothrix sp. LEGE 11397]UYD27079.1 hypothetical protein HGR01_02920 [Tolypothrix sp. PCC 7712]BAY93205.1 hypothetical protein NIES3275_52430 [Microchaete diplosiphon NIES-3275]